MLGLQPIKTARYNWAVLYKKRVKPLPLSNCMHICWDNNDECTIEEACLIGSRQLLAGAYIIISKYSLMSVDLYFFCVGVKYLKIYQNRRLPIRET